LAVPEPTASYSLVLDAYRRTVLPQALQFFGREVLHASAVVGPSGVVGFCAYSQTGKSTLAFALANRGYVPWADDALAFETGAQVSQALALPFAVRLRPESQEYFAVEPLPPEIEPQNGTVITVGAERKPITALCVLSRGAEDEPSAIEPLEAAEAVTALLPHAYWSTLADEPRPVPGGISDARKRSMACLQFICLRTAKGISRGFPATCNLERSCDASKTRRSEEMIWTRLSARLPRIV